MTVSPRPLSPTTNAGIPTFSSTFFYLRDNPEKFLYAFTPLYWVLSYILLAMIVIAFLLNVFVIALILKGYQKFRQGLFYWLSFQLLVTNVFFALATTLSPETTMIWRAFPNPDDTDNSPVTQAPVTVSRPSFLLYVTVFISNFNTQMLPLGTLTLALHRLEIFVIKKWELCNGKFMTFVLAVQWILQTLVSIGLTYFNCQYDFELTTQWYGGNVMPSSWGSYKFVCFTEAKAGANMGNSTLSLATANLLVGEQLLVPVLELGIYVVITVHIYATTRRGLPINAPVVLLVPTVILFVVVQLASLTVLVVVLFTVPQSYALVLKRVTNIVDGLGGSFYHSHHDYSNKQRREEECALIAQRGHIFEIQMRTPSRGKLFHLQGLRGIAILAVTLFHFFPKQFSNGYLGVDLFFALSGYLMCMMLGKHASIGPAVVADFLYRRVRRIVPLYYACTLLTLVSLNFAPPTLQKSNVGSAAEALLFVKNLIRPDAARNYFEKLNEGVDLFTHTWSLSLEMQFYLIFPLIFVVYKQLPEKMAGRFLAIISICSLYFHLNTDPFLQFNSVFSRIWQFVAGMFVYLSSLPAASEDQEDPLITGRLKGGHSGKEVTNYVVIALIALFMAPEPILPDFARVLSIVLTMHLFHFGAVSFLEHRILVFIGEASYAWYLVHWPFAAACRLLAITNVIHVFGVFFLTFMLSVTLHLVFEKQYLQWNGQLVMGFVAVLILLNARELFSLKAATQTKSVSMNFGSATHGNRHVVTVPNGFYYPSDFETDLIQGYENKSAEERIQLNKRYEAEDYDRSMLTHFGKNRVLTNISGEWRYQFKEGLNANSSHKLLVIGNSFGANLMNVILDECKSNFSHMEITFRPKCEVLARTTDSSYHCELDYVFLDAVKQIQPDVLFIVERHTQLLEIISGTTPFNDVVFKTASERITEYQKYVKRRIYIMNDFPELVEAMEAANQALSTGEEPQYNEAVSIPTMIARMRIERLASECSKCKAFDYIGQFFFDGKFRYYDPKYYVSFVARGKHLTPAGWERVRPLIRHLCYAY